MNVVLSKAEIELLWSTKTAQENYVYVCEDGFIYKGQTDGTLQRVPNTNYDDWVKQRNANQTIPYRNKTIIQGTSISDGNILDIKVSNNGIPLMEVSSSSLPTGAAIETKQDIGNASLSNLNVNLGAKADVPASTDIGTFSLISLFKRVLQKLTTIQSNQIINTPMDSVLAQNFSSISVRPTDYHYEVSLGKRQGNTTWNKFGYNSDIDTAGTGTETIWSAGGIFSRMTAAATLSVVSTSLDDDNGGTGANSIIIYGIDANWDTQIEIVMLDGTTPVITTNTWLGVNRMSVYLAGTNGVNVGNINATATGGGSTLQASIPTGEGSTQQSFLFVSRNHKFLVDFFIGNCEKTGGGASPKVRFKGWVYSAVSNSKYLILNKLVDTSSTGGFEFRPSQPFVIGERSLLYYEATTDANDTFVSLMFSGILVLDSGVGI